MDPGFLLGMASIVIAIAYALLAIFFAARIKLPRGGWKRGWRTILAFSFAAMFFIGCAHTHYDLAYDAFNGLLSGHWYQWDAVLSHVLQAIGGIGFYTFGSLWVKINIFDRKDFEFVTKDIEEQVRLMEE